jgi:hypothetical protein
MTCDPLIPPLGRAPALNGLARAVYETVLPWREAANYRRCPRSSRRKGRPRHWEDVA